MRDELAWLSLPRDRKVIEDGEPIIERYYLHIEAELVGRIEDIAREQGVTRSSVLLASFQALLFRYTGSRDLVVDCLDRCGTALSVRTFVREGESFIDLLRQVDAGLHEAKQISPPSPVTFEEAAGPDSALSRGELGLTISAGEPGLRAGFVYNSRAFQPATIEWMSRHYHELLRHVSRNPATKPDDLDLASEGELTLLGQFSHGEPAPMPDVWPHESFQAEADRRPDDVALVYEGGQLTYRELDRRANQLAHHLQAMGVGPDVIVGLLLNCSPELVISTLAVFKAGGAVFLLSPELPLMRLDLLLKLAAPAVVVTRERLEEWERSLAARPGTPPVHRATTENLASLFLTSGSTGQPKLVMEKYARVRPKQHPGESAERHILKSNTGTTFTAAEIMAIATGATLFVAPEGIERDVGALSSFIGEHRITYLILVPSALAALLSLDDLAALRSLQTVHCIGEMISPFLKRRFFERSRARLLVGYGCTEARGATSRCCSPDDDPSLADVGRTNPTMEVFVLDGKLRPAPVGLPGEVYVGGQIAAGYLNDPATTAERFVPHPFSREPGARVFRTGDLARWLPGGNLEILGRIDNQVKIRGFRVELGEIEATLAQHPGIVHAVVAAREDVPGDKRLVAYVVPKDKPVLAASDLRDYLQERLPNFMLPSAFVLMDELPRLSNGKVDRRALPPPGEARPDLGVSYVAPRTPVEGALARIWAEVLRLDRVGIHDNFFELGGHSLLAMQAASRMNHAFQVDFPLRRLFEAPTVAALAELLTVQNRGSGDR